MELEVLELNQEVIEKLKGLQKQRGRKSLISKIIDKDPKLLVKIVYWIEIENRSFGEVISYLKDEGLSISKGGLFNLLQQLKKANVYTELFKSAEKVKRKLRIWYFDPNDPNNLLSDVDYINEFLKFYRDRARHYRIKLMSYIERTIERLGKLPHEWTLMELIELRNRLYEEYKRQLEEKVKKYGNDVHSRYYGLGEQEIEAMARNLVFSWLVAVRRILEFIGKKDIVSKLETRKWKVIHSKIEKRKEYLDFNEVIKVLKSEELTHNEKVWFMLELVTGARHNWDNRKGELMGLRLIDFYEDDGILRCDIYSTKTQKTWRGIRIRLFDNLFLKAGYSLETEIRRLLKVHRNKNIRVYEALGFTVNYLQRTYIKKISKIVGRRITPHHLRHSHATLLIRLGVPMELIAGKPEWSEFGVGWSDLNTLYQFYVALGKWKYREYTKMIDEQLSKL